MLRYASAATVPAHSPPALIPLCPERPEYPAPRAPAATRWYIAPLRRRTKWSPASPPLTAPPCCLPPDCPSSGISRRYGTEAGCREKYPDGWCHDASAPSVPPASGSGAYAGSPWESPWFRKRNKWLRNPLPRSPPPGPDWSSPPPAHDSSPQSWDNDRLRISAAVPCRDAPH